MAFTNAQKLAAVVSCWMRPAISQIATSRLVNLPVFQELQSLIIGSGIVTQNYRLATDLQPYMQDSVNALVTPMLEEYFAKVPDNALPQMAHNIVNTASQKPSVSILDGLIEFTQEDIIELKVLLEQNMPLIDQEEYQVIH